MSEVLSQNEIDALLKALNEGEVDAKEMKEDSKDKRVKKYDFRNPQKMAKDQLRTLEIIHDNFGRLLQTFLSGYLRAPVKTSVLTVDQYAYNEFSNAITNPAFLSIIEFNPLPGEIIIDISTDIAFAMLERLLGGSGENTVESRSFTEIEITLLKRIIQRMMALIAEAWENVIKLNPILSKIETNPQFAQIISPSETIALITLNISIGSIEGMFNICIPHIVIESIMDRLSTKLWFTKTKRSSKKDDMEVIEDRLKKSSILLKAELGSATLSVRELLELQIGDVIRLDNMKTDEAKIKIGSSLKFYCESGTIGNNMAVKITKVKKDGDDTDE
ncbi:flagellar motor switch protein FliM [Clostridiisalibacter paucivorans]|uniref:flagellar motor switch protein FliM n=1 Tax=Clostridiisalibacter paucivorans TaxID=408753 RepID=UPI000478E7E7|nr:flagellar motor switch protein FliM [Clostridiisalibacter paucivorans]